MQISHPQHVKLVHAVISAETIQIQSALFRDWILADESAHAGVVVPASVVGPAGLRVGPFGRKLQGVRAEGVIEHLIPEHLAVR